MPQPRTFGSRLTALGYLAPRPERLLKSLSGTLSLTHLVFLDLGNWSFRMRLSNSILTCLVTVARNLSSFRHFRLRKASFCTKGSFLGFAAYKFLITLKEITCKLFTFLRSITAYGDTRLLVDILILIVRITLRVMRSTCLIDVPHLNMLLFNLRLVWRLVIFTNGCDSRILESLANNLVR